MTISYKQTVKRTADAIQGTYEAFCRTASAEQIDRVEALMRMTFDLGKFVHASETAGFHHEQHKKNS